MRIGDQTNYNKLILKITTDGTITPSDALHKTGNILRDHFAKIAAIDGANLQDKPAADTEDVA
jgi:DNA-directed RNA polymerase alpha subunit